MNQLLPAVFNMVINLAMLLLFIRFFLQFADIRRFDPYAAPAYRLTRIVDVFNNIFPDLSKGRFCTAAVALIVLVELIYLSGNMALQGDKLPPIQLLTMALFSVILTFLQGFRYIIIAMVIVSWIIMLTQNGNPVMHIIMRMAEPIIEPFRRFSPDLGMIDISPIFAFFGIMLLEIVVMSVGQRLLPCSGFEWLSLCRTH